MRIAETSRCADSQAFANTVAAQIPAANRAPEDSAELVAEVNLLESGVAQVRVFDRVLQAEAGARELQLTPRSCDDSAEAVALVLAVLVEAGRGALRVKPPPAPPPVPAEPPPAQPPAPPPESARPSRRLEPRYVWLGPRAGHDLSATAGASYGLLPKVALGGTLGWGIRSTKLWPIWLQVTALHKDATANISARFNTVYAGVLICPLTGDWARVRGRACAGGAVGALWAEAVGLAQNQSKTRELYVVGAELAGSVKLVGPLEFTALVRGDTYPKRYMFFYKSLNGADTWLHKPKLVAASLFAGLALRFR